MQFSRATSAGYLINDLARRFAGALQTRIKPMGLSTGVFPIMVQLWEEDGLTQAELVRRIGIEQATMANTLARMQRNGLIDRRPSRADGRAHEVRLTEKGQKLEAPAIEAALTVNASALSGLSPDERAQFLELLSKTIATFDDAAETAHAKWPAPEDVPNR